MGEFVTITISTGMFRAHELPEGIKVTWSESDTEQVSHAEKVFNSYIKEGWIAFSEVPSNWEICFCVLPILFRSTANSLLSNV